MLDDGVPANGGGNRPEQTDPGDGDEDLMERVHERADFHLALWDREAGEDRLHDGQGHPRGHDREGQPETDQEADVEESSRHYRGYPVTIYLDGFIDRGTVRRLQ